LFCVDISVHGYIVRVISLDKSETQRITVSATNASSSNHIIRARSQYNDRLFLFWM